MSYHDKRCQRCDSLIPERRPLCECGQRFFVSPEVPEGWADRFDLLAQRLMIGVNKVFFSGVFGYWVVFHLAG